MNIRKYSHKTIIIPDKICPYCKNNKWFVKTNIITDSISYTCVHIINERYKRYRNKDIEKYLYREKLYNEKNKDKLKENKRNYQINNREHCNKIHREYQKSHVELFREYHKTYNKNYPEKVIERQLRYRLKYPERIAEIKKRWRVNHPEKVLEEKIKYRKRKQLKLRKLNSQIRNCIKTAFRYHNIINPKINKHDIVLYREAIIAKHKFKEFKKESLIKNQKS